MIFILAFSLHLPLFSLEMEQKTTINFMTPLAGADSSQMNQIIAKFEAENSDIEINHIIEGLSTVYKQKYSTMISVRKAPEVVMMRNYDMPLFMDDLLYLTKAEWKEFGIDFDDIFPTLIEGLEKSGSYNGVPLDIWLFYSAYNRNKFIDAGLDPDLTPKTREEFIETMLAIKEVSPRGITPYHEQPTWSWLWMHLVWQFGGELLNEDFSEPAFYDAGVEAIKLLQDFQDQGIFPTTQADGGGAFGTGNSATLITGSWTINGWRDARGEDFGYDIVPQLGTTEAVFGGSHVLALSKSMMISDRKREASIRWIKFLWDHAMDWYRSGQTPSRISIANSETLKNELPHIYKLSEQAEYVKTFQMFPYASEMLDEISVYLHGALLDRDITAEEAMTESSKVIQYMLNAYWAKKNN